MNKSLKIGLQADPPIQIEKDMLISIIVTELANLNLKYFTNINVYYMGEGPRWMENLYVCKEVKEDAAPGIGQREENNAQIVSLQDELDEEKARNERLVKENDIQRKEIADISKKEKFLNEICSSKDNQINELLDKLQEQLIALKELSSSQTKVDRLQAWFKALIKRERKIFDSDFNVDHVSDYLYMPRIVEFLISKIKELEGCRVKASAPISKVKELESKVRELEGYQVKASVITKASVEYGKQIIKSFAMFFAIQMIYEEVSSEVESWRDIVSKSKREDREFDSSIFRQYLELYGSLKPQYEKAREEIYLEHFDMTLSQFRKNLVDSEFEPIVALNKLQAAITLGRFGRWGAKGLKRWIQS
ncbi:MAG: hypothetical protein HC921_18820 [Synechococcaceae cyanobacterium SM2_3_1]|nr:hypothetical protein [Synechococcaceae cyanobacterium SM2_3_1]